MISLIIPAYNEEKRICRTLDALCSYMEAHFPDYEVLVADDGSQDRTLSVVRAYDGGSVRALSYGENRGKGGAVRYGMEHARGDYLFFTDADLPYPPESIGQAAALFDIGKADLILGSRSEGANGYPWYRKAASHGFSLVVDLFLHLHVPDTQCGFKAFRRAAAQQIFAKSTLSGWGFDVELIFIAKKLGLSIERLPVSLSHDNEGSKIHVVRDSLHMLREVARVRKNDKQGLYAGPRAEDAGVSKKIRDVS